MSATLQTIALSKIDPNPHRGLDSYPWIEQKIDQLMRSIDAVGLWEGVIAREHGSRYQLAFGHHRIEAAKRSGLTRVPLIVRALSDEDMLKLMGRENGEDYSTQFLIMLNAWEAAVIFFADRRKAVQPIEIASLLGWLSGKGDKMNLVARACAGAHKLISTGHFERTDYEGLIVSDAREVVERTAVRIEGIQKMAKATNRSQRETETMIGHVVKGAKKTIKGVKAGEIAQKDIRGSVDANAFKSAQTSKAKNNPLFAVYGNAVAEQIEKMVSKDSAATKLDEISKVIDQITRFDDAEALRRIDFALGELTKRGAHWQKRLTPSSSKIVSIRKLLEKQS